MGQSVFQDIEAAALGKEFQKAQDEYALVDVRTVEEFAEGHLPGARHLPFDEMPDRHQELKDIKDKNILLICRSGRRSVIAAHTLAEVGYRHLFNLKGGMLEWTGPVEK